MTDSTDEGQGSEPEHCATRCACREFEARPPDKNQSHDDHAHVTAGLKVRDTQSAANEKVAPVSPVVPVPSVNQPPPQALPQMNCIAPNPSLRLYFSRVFVLVVFSSLWYSLGFYKLMAVSTAQCSIVMAMRGKKTDDVTNFLYHISTGSTTCSFLLFTGGQSSEFVLMLPVWLMSVFNVASKKVSVASAAAAVVFYWCLFFVPPEWDELSLVQHRDWIRCFPVVGLTVLMCSHQLVLKHTLQTKYETDLQSFASQARDIIGRVLKREPLPAIDAAKAALSQESKKLVRSRAGPDSTQFKVLLARAFASPLLSLMFYLGELRALFQLTLMFYCIILICLLLVWNGYAKQASRFFHATLALLLPAGFAISGGVDSFFVLLIPFLLVHTFHTWGQRAGVYMEAFVAIGYPLLLFVPSEWNTMPSFLTSPVVKCVVRGWLFTWVIVGLTVLTVGLKNLVSNQSKQLAKMLETLDNIFGSPHPREAFETMPITSRVCKKCQKQRWHTAQPSAQLACLKDGFAPALLFACTKCGHTSEELIFPEKNWRAPPRCPIASCEISTRVDKEAVKKSVLALLQAADAWRDELDACRESPLM